MKMCGVVPADEKSFKEDVEMLRNPDTYLLYEYMKKIPFTVRIKVCLDESPSNDEAVVGKQGGNHEK